MDSKLAKLPMALAFVFAAVVLAAFALQVMTGTPLWSERGPLSVVQALLLGLLGLPCLSICLHHSQEQKQRIVWGIASLGLVLVALALLTEVIFETLPESGSFDYPALAAWSAAATAILLIERTAHPLGRCRSFLYAGFVMHCVAFLADLADGGLLQLTSISLGLLGSADEVLELLCLAAYFIGLTLLALDLVAGALWRPFDTAPRPLAKVFAVAFNPSRSYTERWLARSPSVARGSASNAAFLHAAYRHTRWRLDDRNARVNLLCQIALWPLQVCATALYYTLLIGPAISRQHGKGLLRQAGEQLELGLTKSIAPRAYYMFELYLDDRRGRAAGYLQRYETKRGLYRFIKRQRSLSSRLSPLTDKADFIDRCLDHGLPTLPYFLLVAEDGCLRGGVARDGALPREDLFVKPNKGKGGSGAERWQFLEDGSYLGGDGARMTATDLLSRFRTRRYKGGCLVQPAARNHPQLAGLSGGALATVRVVTCIDERGEVEITNAAMRFSRGTRSVVDNFHAGGLAAKVEVGSGMLGAATSMGLRAAPAWYEVHPDNGARIAGRVLPRWEEAVSLARRAHEAFDTRVFVGWDIALLESGWYLVEGNAAPDLDIIQRTHGMPIGSARFGQLLAYHTASLLREP
ncbi:MAG: sugar-transfer associated ATP-grasp domain-containing protein [Rhodovibrionaceae bacterium]